MQQYQISEEALNKVIQYLATCRWSEANPVIQAIQTARPIPEAQPVQPTPPSNEAEEA